MGQKSTSVKLHGEEQHMAFALKKTHLSKAAAGCEKEWKEKYIVVALYPFILIPFAEVISNN